MNLSKNLNDLFKFTKYDIKDQTDDFTNLNDTIEKLNDFFDEYSKSPENEFDSIMSGNVNESFRYDEYECNTFNITINNTTDSSLKNFIDNIDEYCTIKLTNPYELDQYNVYIIKTNDMYMFLSYLYCYLDVRRDFTYFDMTCSKTLVDLLKYENKVLSEYINKHGCQLGLNVAA
jgi:Fe-S-cluster formation regulator IscX/YfhJ